MRELTLRELNRTLLARQLLLDRRRLPLGRVLERLVALQAQYAPAPYLSLWARLEGFRKEQLTRALARGAAIKANTLRGTLHVSARATYPDVAAAALDTASAAEPLVRTAPVGPWPHTKPSPLARWPEPLPDARAAAIRVVRAYLAAYGPASRDDVEQFTSFRVRQMAPALDGLRTFADEQGRRLYDVPRAPILAAGAPAPVRFLPPFDSMLLAHRDRTRILPDAYRDTVIRKVNGTMLPTFTVDGLVAGAWRIERRRGDWTLWIEPFEPLPARVRRELDEEGARLVAFYAS